MLVCSANTTYSLQKQLDLYLDYSLKHPADLADIAYTRAVRRAQLPHRAFAIVRDGHVIKRSDPVIAPLASPPKKVTMIFTGQGSQWFGMGRALLDNIPEFSQDIGTLDCILQALRIPPKWSLIGALNPILLLHAKLMVEQRSCESRCSLNLSTMQSSPSLW